MPPLTRAYVGELAHKSLTEDGMRALAGYLALPGVEAIEILPELPIHAMIALDLGLPLGLLRDVPSAAALKQEVAHYIQERGAVGYRKDSRWSELQAGGIMRALGADVEFLTPGRMKGLKTPDVRTRWPGGSIVDVEVTRAERREGHTEVSAGLTSLAGAVGASGHQCHYLALFTDGSSKKALEEALNAIVKVEIGQSLQSPGRWFVTALPREDRELLVDGRADKAFAPVWWPESGPSAIAVTTAIGSSFSPYVRMVSKFTGVDYMNPIRAKADKHQGAEGNGFVIALDVSELPAAHEQIRDELPIYFDAWPKISGVLLFDYLPWIGYGKKEWQLTFHANAKANIAHPKELDIGRDRYSLSFTMTA